MSKETKYLLSIISGALCLAFLLFGFTKLTVSGQSLLNPNSSNTSTSQTSKIETPQTPINKTAAVSPVISANATADNIRFRDSLQWAFGGKSQRGWYLYV